MFYLKILSALIALSAVTSNAFVCVLFLRNKVWLGKPYNVFILCLAVTDMMTGFLMFITPGMIIEEPLKIPNNSVFGTIYCKGLWSRWPLFALGAVSVYTCLVLTVERWTAICRPFKYRTKFTSKRLIMYIFLVWIGGITVSSMAANETTYQLSSSNFTKPRCKISPLVKGDLIGIISTISVGLKFLIPSVIILVLYAVTIAKLLKSHQFNPDNRRSIAIKNITKMAAAASLSLVVCWLPNQVYFILHKFRLAELFSIFHNITILVVFINSTLNPFIYALWGKHFYRAIMATLCQCRRDPRESENTRFGLGGNYPLTINYSQKNNPNVE